MSSFKENAVTVCQSLGRFAVPVLAIATTAYAGAEASELLDIWPVIGGYAGFVLGTAGWLGIEAYNAPSDQRLARIDESITQRERTIDNVEKNNKDAFGDNAFTHVDCPMEGVGFNTFEIRNN